MRRCVLYNVDSDGTAAAAAGHAYFIVVLGTYDRCRLETRVTDGRRNRRLIAAGIDKDNLMIYRGIIAWGIIAEFHIKKSVARAYTSS